MLSVNKTFLKKLKSFLKAYKVVNISISKKTKFYFLAALLISILISFIDVKVFELIQNAFKSFSEIKNKSTFLIPIFLFIASDVIKIIQNYLLTKISVLAGCEISSYARKCLLSGGIEKSQTYAATEVYALTYTSVELIVTGIIRPFIEVVTSALIILLISLIVISKLKINFEQYILLFSFLIIFSIAILLMGRFFKTEGQNVNKKQAALSKAIDRFWSGIKQYTLSNNLYSKAKNIDKIDSSVRYSIGKIMFIGGSIRFFIEIAAIIFIVCIIFITEPKFYSSLFTSIFTYGVLAQRIYPFFQSFIRNTSKFSGFISTINSIADLNQYDFETTDEIQLKNKNKLNMKIELQINNSFRKIDLSRKGIILIKGKSGSGKSTLLEKIALLRKDKNFQYILNNQKFNNSELKKRALWRSNFRLLEQDPFIEDDTISSLVVPNYIRDKNHRDSEFNLRLREVGFSDQQISEFKNKKLSRAGFNVSGGERRRIAFLNLLKDISNDNDHQIILLDEPTNGLDENSKLKFINYLSYLSKKYLFIIATHDSINIKELEKIEL